MARQHDDGMLEIILAQQAASLAPIHVGQADIEENKVGVLAFHGGEGLRGAMSDVRLELFVQRELLRQRQRKVLIIVDNQDIARIAHD